jgi:histidyl-tRNA synthetase
MFRYERPQKGRLRQFKQFGIECIGINNSMADVEVISLGHAFLDRLNILDKINLKINTLGDSETRLRYRKALVDYLNDYKSELSNESIKRLSENPLRILDSKNDTDKKIIINAPNIIDYLNEASKERFEKVCIGLSALKIKYQIDKNLVRGLDYYCHTAFEFITSDLGSQGTVLAGGRYDGLAKMLGGVDTPGVGWAAGVDRLSLMINEEFVNKPDLVLMAVSENLEPLLMPIMKKLVDKGLKVEILITGNMSKKFKRANKVDASYAIILGEEELSKNIIKLKNLIIGSERYVSLDEAIKVIKNL